MKIDFAFQIGELVNNAAALKFRLATGIDKPVTTYSVVSREAIVMNLNGRDALGIKYKCRGIAQGESKIYTIVEYVDFQEHELAPAVL